MNDEKICKFPGQNQNRPVRAIPILADSKESEESFDLPAFLIKYKKKFVYCVCAFIIAALALYKFVILHSHQKEAASFSAANDFQELLKKPNNDLMVKLLENIKLNPNLQTRYEGILAQKLLNESGDDQAIEMAKQAIAHQKGLPNPVYSEFANNTLDIVKASHTGNYELALKKALDLKNKLSKESTDSLLYLNHLFRIAALAQETSQTNLELETWNEIQQLITSKDVEIKKWVALFNQGDLTLTDYILERINIIK